MTPQKYGFDAGQTDANHSPKLEVWLQAVHITHRPACWASISGLMAGAPKDTHAHRVAQATNLLSDVTAQTLAQAQMLIKAFMLLAIAVQVSNTFLMQFCSLCPYHEIQAVPDNHIWTP